MNNALKFKMDLSNIPQKYGIGKLKNTLVYDWGNAINKRFSIVDCKECIYEFEIINYTKENSILEIKNLSGEIYNIKTSNLLHGRLSVITKHIVRGFKLNIGDSVTSNNRNLNIIDKKYVGNSKYYTCKCCNCNGKYDILESHLLIKESKCPYCLGRKVLVGFNDIKTIRPDLVKYIKNKSDAFKYTISSGKGIKVECPDCKFEKIMTIAKLSSKGFSCPRCSDNVSYSEKFMLSLLDQLGIEYEYQLTKRKQKWCDSFMYDFYVNSDFGELIIETNGIQHYEINGFHTLSNTSLEENITNDYVKRQLALSNNIKFYIELDCRESSLNWMKDTIMKSQLPELLKFREEDVDWIECEKSTTTSFMKKACELKKENPEYSNAKIGELLKRSTPTIISYLKRGKTIGWL